MCHIATYLNGLQQLRVYFPKVYFKNQIDVFCSFSSLSRSGLKNITIIKLLIAKKKVVAHVVNVSPVF